VFLCATGGSGEGERTNARCLAASVIMSAQCTSPVTTTLGWKPGPSPPALGSNLRL
jgi:hypothetical protein